VVEALLALLALGVFGVLWLFTQDWFDLLPRKVTRWHVAGGGAIVLAVACYAAPTAFQSGFERYVGHATEQLTERLRAVFDNLPTGVPASSSPAPTPASPSPASGGR
jgi:hypothetical protein